MRLIRTRAKVPKDREKLRGQQSIVRTAHMITTVNHQLLQYYQSPSLTRLYSRRRTASTTSSVLLLPPRSGVRTCPSLMT